MISYKSKARNLAADITQKESDEMLALFTKSMEQTNILRLHFRSELADYCHQSFQFACADFYNGIPFEKGRHHTQLSEGIKLATVFIVGYLLGKDKVARDNYNKDSSQ